ncbi:hypothetical protein WJX72_000872 [[Myrmecia] bisecta]|uniref:Uncharacterized protein n=1 Tax=[Myrmecia] bisecta TaxID=41462 RepID=A0AAW1QB43_9CHLO
MRAFQGALGAGGRRDELAGVDTPEVRAYKLGKRRWSYNQCELRLSQHGGDGSLEVIEALPQVPSDDEAAQEATPVEATTTVTYHVRLNNNHCMYVDIYLVYDSPVPNGLEGPDAGYQWRQVDRNDCVKGCQGTLMRAIQRYGRASKKRGATEEAGAEAGPGAQSPREGGRRGKERCKDARYLYLAFDEAGTHVGSRNFRLLACAYDRADGRRLGTTCSPPIRVVANNDVPTGAAQFHMDLPIVNDWVGWNTPPLAESPDSSNLERTPSGSPDGGGSQARELGAPAKRKASRPKRARTSPTKKARANPPTDSAADPIQPQRHSSRLKRNSDSSNETPPTGGRSSDSLSSQYSASSSRDPQSRKGRQRGQQAQRAAPTRRLFHTVASPEQRSERASAPSLPELLLKHALASAEQQDQDDRLRELAAYHQAAHRHGNPATLDDFDLPLPHHQLRQPEDAYSFLPQEAPETRFQASGAQHSSQAQRAPEYPDFGLPTPPGLPPQYLAGRHAPHRLSPQLQGLVGEGSPGLGTERQLGSLPYGLENAGVFQQMHPHQRSRQAGRGLAGPDYMHEESILPLAHLATLSASPYTRVPMEMSAPAAFVASTPMASEASTACPVSVFDASLSSALPSSAQHYADAPLSSADLVHAVSEAVAPADDMPVTLQDLHGLHTLLPLMVRADAAHAAVTHTSASAAESARPGHHRRYHSDALSEGEARLASFEGGAAHSSGLWEPSQYLVDIELPGNPPSSAAAAHQPAQDPEEPPSHERHHSV